MLQSTGREVPNTQEHIQENTQRFREMVTTTKTYTQKQRAKVKVQETGNSKGWNSTADTW